MCTYNGGPHIAAQLESLLAQTRLPDEVVISDDGSTDGTWDVLEAFARRARSMGVAVDLKRQPGNLGFVANFSETLCRATGGVLFLCDQDDVWHAEKLEAMAARFAMEPDLLMLASDARLVDARGHDLGTTAFAAIGLKADERSRVHGGHAFEVLLRRSMVVGATAALRREVMGSALPVGRGWIHDEWLAAVLSAMGRLDVIERPLIDYRQHGANQVGMRRRGAVDWWFGMVVPRREQYETELVRVDALKAHLLQLGVSPEYLEGLERKREHFRARVALGGRPRWSRVAAIVSEMFRGNYRRYGTGARTALRDVIRRD